MKSDGEQDQKGENPASWFHSFKSGGASSLLTTVITFPLYKTVFRQQLHSTMVHKTVEQLHKEGSQKLYRGVAPPILMTVLNRTLVFGLQDTLLQQLSWADTFLPGMVRPALAGLGTGVVEALLFTPFERVQNILQNSSNDSILPTHRSVLARLRSEALASGIYRGFLPILARNALGNSLYFGLKDPLSSAFWERGFSPLASSFLSGVVNSIVISLPLYPLSVLVAIMQAKVGGEKLGLRASGHHLWEMKERRLTLLYRGGLLVILRSCITWGITTAIYDQLMRRAS